MNEIVASWTELIWRDFFINKEIFYEEIVDGVLVSSSWETISDLCFVTKTRLIKVTTQSGKTFVMHKDEVQKWRTSHERIDVATTHPRNKKKKRT